MMKLVGRISLLVLLWTVWSDAAPQVFGDERVTEAKKPGGNAAAPGSMVVRFIDDSTLKVILRDPHVEVQTSYGKLVIPIRDIQQIDLGRRISEDAAKQIDTATAQLASTRFREREDASRALLSLGQKAYPALVRAVKSTDPEVCRRAENLLEQIRETISAELLEMPDHDVVYTEKSRIAGKITTTTFKVTTFQFGDLELKLADAFSLRSPEVNDLGAESKVVLADPGNLGSYQNQIGKTFRFRVTGAVAGSLWGTGVYTTDSSLALAAVHAGVLKPGQTESIRVRIVPSPQIFQASTQNGVSSAGYGTFAAAFQVSR
jgi:hypothetical protein